SGARAPAALVPTSSPVPTKVPFRMPAPGAMSSLSPGSAIAASLPRCQSVAQAAGEHVVGELGHGPLPAGLPHGGPPVGVPEKVVYGEGDLIDVGGVAHHETGLAVLHRLGGAAAVAGDLGHPGRGRLHEDDPEPLLLEAGPAVPAEHGVHV